MYSPVMKYVLLICCLFLSVKFAAAQALQAGDYTVRVSTVVTTSLPEESLRKYGLKQAKNQAILMVKIEKQQNEKTLSVPSDITVTATNLMEQLRKIAMREVKEDDLVYYVGEFHVNDQDTLDFKIDFHPQGKPDKYTVNYRQRFFTG